MMSQERATTESNNAADHLRKWDTLVDEKIRAWLGDGNMSEHPLAGQALKLDFDEHIPEDERMAAKIMKDNDAIPPWMSLAFVLREHHERILRRLKHYSEDYVQRKHEALLKGSAIMERQAEERWQNATNTLRTDIAKYNSEILNYNLQVPAGINQMIPLQAENLIQAALNQAQKSK